MLKIAMISCWHVHTEGYAQELKSRDDVQLTVVWDEEPERGMEFAKRYNIAFQQDLDKLLGRDDVDAVCINSPTNTHPEILIKSAKAKKHIFTEKVLALTNAEASQIRDAIEESGVKFCISFPHRTFAQNLFAKKVMDEGLLGNVNYMRVRNAHNGASAGWLPAHFYDEKQCGGGAMIDLGAHPMYLIAWIMGKPAQVASAFTHVTGRDVEDNAVTVMKYENGAIAVSETGFITGFCPFMLELYGTDGSLVISGDEVKLISSKLNDNAGKYGGWINPNQLPEALPSPLNQFVDGVLYEKEIIFGIEDAVTLTEMMDAAYRAHKQGSFVTF